MNDLVFRRAVREKVSLLIGLVGASGSGKTYTAMLLATGLSGGKPFAVIDTENDRAKHYAEDFTFDHVNLRPPFRPQTYQDAILAADKAGYPVIVVDSASHEHAGEGGLLDWHEEELAKRAGDDWSKRDRMTMAAWIKPKMAHKQFVQKLLQVKAHLILCFRAEEKVEMVKGPDGKLQIVPKKSPVGAQGWIPVCEKNLPYELTASFLLTADAPGFPKPIKLQAQHKPFFPLDKPITAEAGEALAKWAGGTGKAPKAAKAEKAEKTTLKQVLDMISKASTTEAMAQAAEAAGALAKADDKQSAREAYKKRAQHLKEAAAAGDI